MEPCRRRVLGRRSGAASEAGDARLQAAHLGNRLSAFELAPHRESSCVSIGRRSCGRERSPPSGFYRARYYNPTLGRFISEDLLGFPGGPDPNLYAYVANGPVMFGDPLGLDPSNGCGFLWFGCIASAFSGLFSEVANGFSELSKLAWDVTGYGLAVIAVMRGASVRPCGNGEQFAICVEETDLVPWWATAWTLGHTVFAKEELDPCEEAHEITHVAQQDASGFFVQSYIWESIFGGYQEDNRFEREAYQVEAACYANSVG